jgi:hypothetical protein
VTAYVVTVIKASSLLVVEAFSCVGPANSFFHECVEKYGKPAVNFNAVHVRGTL